MNPWAGSFDLRDVLQKGKRARNTYWPRYVFIHINKTAGSSIERALGLRFEHKTAIQKRAELGARRWTRAFKFAIVRNPWTRALSHYRYRVQTNQTGLGDRHLSFAEWARAVYADRDPRYRDQDQMFLNQWDWLTDESGTCIVDFVGRFETLESDFGFLSRLLGVSAKLPHAKSSARTSIGGSYGPETADLIGTYFSSDLEMLNYRLPDLSVTSQQCFHTQDPQTGRPAGQASEGIGSCR